MTFSFYQNGKILSQKLVSLPYTEIWEGVSKNDQLISEFGYLRNLDFYQLLHESDSISIKGFNIEPKISGKYPVVIFNRGGNRNFAELNLSTMHFYTSKLAEQGYIIIASNYRD